MNGSANKISFIYFDVANAISVHDRIIKSNGGMEGTKKRRELDSQLEHVESDIYCREREEKITNLVYSINKHHAFNDGNKRSSLVLGAYFLKLNGFDCVVKRFIHEMENIVVWVADNVIYKTLLHQIICSILYEDDYSESVKLALIEAVDTTKYRE